MQKEDNPRYINCEYLIVTTLKEMAIHNNFENITIKSLCKKAGIDRTTFYLHYKNIESALFSILNKDNLEFFNKINKSNIQSIDFLIKEHILFMVEKGKFFEKMMSNDNYSYILARNITEYLSLHKEIYTPLKTQNEYEFNVISSHITISYLSLCKQWIEDKKAIPIDNFIKIATNLIKYGINKYI